MKIFISVIYKNGLEKQYELIPEDGQVMEKEELVNAKGQLIDLIKRSYQEKVNGQLNFIDENGWERVVNILSTSEIGFKISE